MPPTALGDAASLMRLHDVEGEEDAIRRALMTATPLDEVVPDPGDGGADGSGNALRATPPAGNRPRGRTCRARSSTAGGGLGRNVHVV